MPAPKGNQYAKGNRGGTGRPTKYRGLWHCRKISELFHLPNMSLKRCAEIFDISESTLQLWLDTYEEFFDAYREAKDFMDARVAYTLRETAEGHRKNTEKVFYDKDSPCPECNGLGVIIVKVGRKIKSKTKCVECGGTGRGRVVRVKTKTYFPPDTNAAKFYLMNRQGWKSTKAVEWDGNVTINEEGDSIDVESLSPETREMILRDIERAAQTANANANANKTVKEDAKTETQTKLATNPKKKPTK